MHFNCRNLNGSNCTFAIIHHLMLLYTWEQTNSSNKYKARFKRRILHAPNAIQTIDN